MRSRRMPARGAAADWCSSDMAESVHVLTAVGMTGRHDFGTPEWWRDRLLDKIARRRIADDVIARYVDGDHPLAFAKTRYREAFGALLDPLRDDWLGVVVEAATERLVVDGFRAGGTDETGDDAAWEIWQANGLDSRSGEAHDESVKFGVAFLVTGPGDDGPVVLTVPASRAAVERDPVRPTRRLAGVHTWMEADGSERCVLWTPDARVEWARRAGSIVGLAGWEQVGDIRNRVGVVPIVPLVNRPSLRHPDGRSDIDPIMPMQDAINKLLADMMVASEYAAFRQRYATGIEIPTDPETGQQLDSQFIASQSTLWTTEDPDVRFGEFSASDLTNYTGGIEMVVRHIAAQTRTPPHYLMGEIVNSSAEALKAAEAGLVARVRAKMLTFGESWEDAVRLAFAWQGDAERATNSRIETIWRDPETRTEAERVDAITKLASIGVPQEALWSMIPGMTPQKLSRWRAMRDQDALALGLSFGGAAPVAAGEPVVPVSAAAQQATATVG